MTSEIRKIVVLGANGTMGAGAGALFSSAGFTTVLLARTQAKAEAARARVEAMLDGKASPPKAGGYDELEHELADADLVFEAVAEDYDGKRDLFARVDAARRPGTIVASVTSGLSIAALCADRSDDFRSCFLGVHLFNPPAKIPGCELIPHMET